MAIAPTRTNYNDLNNTYKKRVNSGIDSNGQILNGVYKPLFGYANFHTGIPLTTAISEIELGQSGLDNGNVDDVIYVSTYEFELVELADVGANYVLESVGNIKTIKEYRTGAVLGSYAKLITKEYSFTSQPCIPSKIIETNSQVT